MSDEKTRDKILFRTTQKLLDMFYGYLLGIKEPDENLMNRLKSCRASWSSRENRIRD